MTQPQSTTDDRRVGPLVSAYGEDGVSRSYVAQGVVILNPDGSIPSSGPAVSAGPLADTASLSVVPSASQNPIYDHANGTKTSVTSSTAVITPPSGCQYVRISSDVDLFVNTAGNAAVDDGSSIRLVANSPEIIPVVATVAVYALSSSGTATVRCTPMKVR